RDGALAGEAEQGSHGARIVQESQRGGGGGAHVLRRVVEGEEQRRERGGIAPAAHHLDGGATDRRRLVVEAREERCERSRRGEPLGGAQGGVAHERIGSAERAQENAGSVGRRGTRDVRRDRNQQQPEMRESSPSLSRRNPTGKR